MCDLKTVFSGEKIEGYKVVAKKLKGKKYFSIAMGFKYPLDEHVPVVRKQRKICATFINIISKSSVAYSKGMIGRTAIFLSFNDAHKVHQHFMRKGVERGYKLVIVTAEVSEDIMVGSYFIANVMHCRVAAGRHIHFIEEL